MSTPSRCSLDVVSRSLREMMAWISADSDQRSEMKLQHRSHVRSSASPSDVSWSSLFAPLVLACLRLGFDVDVVDELESVVVAANVVVGSRTPQWACC